MPTAASCLKSRGNLPSSIFHQDRIPCTPTTVVSPEAIASLRLNHVPTIGTTELADLAKLVDLAEEELAELTDSAEEFALRFALRFA